MPIEIRELVIKMSVDDSNSNQNNSGLNENTIESLSALKEDIINECVNRLATQIRLSKER